MLSISAKDYYEILGIKRDANDKEIKQRFRQLALKYHPDKNTDPKAEETFRSITEAYDILSDPAKRREYDMGGQPSFTTHFGDFHFDMNEMFQHFDMPFDPFFDSEDENMFFSNEYPFEFSDVIFPDFDQIYTAQSSSSQENCRTITRRHGNTVTTTQECF